MDSKKDTDDSTKDAIKSPINTGKISKEEVKKVEEVEEAIESEDVAEESFEEFVKVEVVFVEELVKVEEVLVEVVEFAKVVEKFVEMEVFVLVVEVVFVYEVEVVVLVEEVKVRLLSPGRICVCGRMTYRKLVCLYGVVRGKRRPHHENWILGAHYCLDYCLGYSRI